LSLCPFSTTVPCEVQKSSIFLNPFASSDESDISEGEDDCSDSEANDDDAPDIDNVSDGSIGMKGGGDSEDSEDDEGSYDLCRLVWCGVW
jgi:hypothetical protein